MKNKITEAQISDLIRILKDRFHKNMHRHQGLDWVNIEKNLLANKEKLWSLNEMEATGGEPDVIDKDKKSMKYLFCDCSVESPNGRRSLCYDNVALESRKENKPKDSAIEMASNMGIELLNEMQYQNLQKLERVDTKTSSWILTPPEIRKLGGAIFGDFRFGRTFIYHNGAESYYQARGFRGLIYI